MKVTPTQIILVDDEEQRSIVVEHLDQYYWSDNGGETDGPSYLLEADEIDEEVLVLGLPIQSGSRIDDYIQEYTEALDQLGVDWTGWQAEGYALVDAPVEVVEEALSKVVIEDEEE